MAENVLKYLEDKLTQKDMLINKLLMKNQAYKTSIKKKEKQLISIKEQQLQELLRLKEEATKAWRKSFNEISDDHLGLNIQMYNHILSYFP